MLKRKKKNNVSALLQNQTLSLFPSSSPIFLFRKPHGTLQQSQNSPKSPIATTASNSPAPPISLSSPHFHHCHCFSLSQFYIRSLRQLVSALVASYAILSSSDSDNKSSNPLYAGIKHVVHKSSDSFKKVFHHAKQTGVTVSVLWQSLSSVLSSTNHEVCSGFELRVAAPLADISAANASRKAAIVSAGGSAVVDWLLELVAAPRDGCGTQAESARALTYLIADPNVSAAVLGRPHAIPNLLRFIFSCHP
jgi:hypothetical protein